MVVAAAAATAAAPATVPWRGNSIAVGLSGRSGIPSRGIAPTLGFHDARCQLFFLRTPALRAARIAVVSPLLVLARLLVLLIALAPLSVRACAANTFSTGDRSDTGGESGLPCRASPFNRRDAGRGGEWMKAPGMVGDGVRECGGEVGADEGPDEKKADEVGVWLSGDGGDSWPRGTRCVGRVRGKAPRKSPGSSASRRATSAWVAVVLTGRGGMPGAALSASSLSSLFSVSCHDARLELHCRA